MTVFVIHYQVTLFGCGYAVLGYLKLGSHIHMHLKNGAKIAIIGGGPAGSFFAHFALTYARQLGINVSVTIFEKKDFARKGAPGCNMSAGVLSEALLGKLSEHNIHLPSTCIQQEIEGYFLQAPEYGIPLHYPHPPHKTRIATVFRGSGPKFAVKWTGLSRPIFINI